MTKTKNILTLEDFDQSDNETTLIAIHSSMPIYRLAYFINRDLNLKFARDKDIDILYKSSKSYYLKYSYFDKYLQSTFYLLKNKTLTQAVSKTSQDGFFNEPSTYYTYMIPEHKKVDYFLQIEDYYQPKTLLNKLRVIVPISTAYIIDTTTLKSYKTLIFE